MKRRRFIGLVGGATVAWPLLARAQQPSVRTVGYLSSRSEDVEVDFIAAVRRGLKETGHVDGNNLRVEPRWADGHYERLSGLASDLVRQRVEVIITTGGVISARAALAATRTIPVVFTSGSDPVKEGLVKSLNRPGGNVTGAYVFTTVLGPKRLELLHELVPQADRIAFLINPTSAVSEPQAQEILGVGAKLGLQIHVMPAATVSELEQVFSGFSERGVRAVLMGADLFFQVQRDKLINLAASHRIPVMYEWPEFVTAGGLISYSSVRDDAWIQVGVYAGRILNGAKPADLPVLQSTHFVLSINRKTANTLGLEIPSKLLALADDVID